MRLTALPEIYGRDRANSNEDGRRRYADFLESSAPSRCPAYAGDVTTVVRVREVVRTQDDFCDGKPAVRVSISRRAEGRAGQGGEGGHASNGGDAELRIIDEIGYLPFGREQANLFFRAVAKHYDCQRRHRSTRPSRVASIHRTLGWRTCRWRSAIRPELASYQRRLRSSVARPSCTKRLPNRSSSCVSPAFRRTAGGQPHRPHARARKPGGAWRPFVSAGEPRIRHP